MTPNTDTPSLRERDIDWGISLWKHPADSNPPLDWQNQGTENTVTKPNHPPFLRLPVEIIYHIASDIEDQTALSSLARTCRTCHHLLNPILYRNNIKAEHSSSLFWGAAHGVLNTVKLAHAAGANLNSKGGLLWRDTGNGAVIFLSPPNTTHHNAATAIHWAARYNRPDIVNWLLDHNVDINIASTGLCFWSYDRSPDIWLRGNYFTCRPLHDTLSRRNLRCARLLINRGASGGLEATDEGYTALHSAAANGLVSIINLLDQKLLIGDINIRDQEGNTALHHLSSLRRKTNSPVISQILSKILSLGADIEVRNNSGYTPLVHACREKNFVVAGNLLALGANPDPDRATPTGDNRPLSLIILARVPLVRESELSRRAKRRLNNESLAFLRALVTAGVDVDARLALPGFGMGEDKTDLMQACSKGDTAVARLLVQSGASVNAETSDGYTPLYYAVEPGNAFAAQTSAMLLKHGARVDTPWSINWNFKWLLWCDRKFHTILGNKVGVANVSRQGLAILVEQCLCWEQDDGWINIQHTRLLIHILNVAKNTYGLQNGEILGFLDLFIDWEKYEGLQSLINCGFIRLVMEQDEAYQPHCLNNPGTIYYSTEALLERSLFRHRGEISCSIFKNLKVYAAGPRFRGGSTLLHSATTFILQSDDAEYESSILQYILDTLGPEDIDVFDDALCTPLSLAVQLQRNEPKSLDVVRQLLEAGAYPHLEPGDDVLDAICPDDEDERRIVKKRFVTAFNMAIQGSGLEIVQLMLTVGNNALPDIPPMSTTSYVHEACKLPESKILEELKKHGADMNGGDQCLNPPAAMILGGIWNKDRLRQRIDCPVEAAIGHLKLLLDFSERIKSHKSLAVPPKVYDLLTEIASYTGPDVYKQGVREMVKKRLGVYILGQTLTYQLDLDVPA